MKPSRLIGVLFVCLSFISFHAVAATVQLSGTGYPAPGGNDGSGAGNSGRDNGIEGFGRTWTLSNFDNTQYDTLYYVLGDYPSGIWDASGPRIGSGGLDLLTFNAGTSDFLNGIVQWTGTTTFNVFGSPVEYNARFTLSITDTSDVAQSLIDASTIVGMPTSVGAAYEVTGDFKANWLFELETSTGVWTPALDAFDSLATDPGAGMSLSSGGAFYYTAVVPVPAAVWLFGSGLLGLVGIARRRSA